MLPPSPHKPVCTWISLVIGLLIFMILLGGYTRLMGAGLSIVEWAPLTGILPPFSTLQWHDAFAAYQATPEFHQVNPDISLFDFQHLFWIEYAHRLLGRLIGLVFLGPLVIFWRKKLIPRPQLRSIVLVLGLGALQGLMGWLMVKSGLLDAPHVSPLRLAFHLILAVAIVGILWNTRFQLVGEPHTPAPHLHRYARMALTLSFVTLFYGALVAGSKAGWIYNTFPFMGDDFLPPDAWALRPIWANFFENPTMIQFMHRVLALLTFTSLMGLFYIGRHKNIRRLLLLVGGIGVAQVGLGITTLLLQVPLWAGLLHQLGGILLILALLRVTARTRPTP